VLSLACTNVTVRQHVAVLSASVVQEMTPETMRSLELINEEANARDKEILRLIQSVNELASLFRELNVLVIEQVLAFL